MLAGWVEEGHLSKQTSHLAIILHQCTDKISLFSYHYEKTGITINTSEFLENTPNTGINGHGKLICSCEPLFRSPQLLHIDKTVVTFSLRNKTTGNQIFYFKQIIRVFTNKHPKAKNTRRTLKTCICLPIGTLVLGITVEPEVFICGGCQGRGGA